MRPTLAVLFLVNVLNFYDRQALGAVLEPLRHEFQLTDQQLGAIPTAFIIVYALAGIPLARLADRWSRKRDAGHRCLGMGGADGARRRGHGVRDAVCNAPGSGDRRGGLRAGGDELDRDIVPPQRRSRRARRCS